MDIVLTGRNGQWLIEDGYVSLRLQFAGADSGTIEQKWHGFPATKEGFNQYQSQLQARLGQAVYDGREQEEPVASACQGQAAHWREVVGILADIRRQWESAVAAEERRLGEDQQNVRRFAFEPEPCDVVHPAVSYTAWPGVSREDPRGSVQAIGNAPTRG